MSSSPTSTGAAGGALSASSEKRETSRIIVDGDPMRQIGNVARIGHAVGERGLVDQQLGAAIGQHIGDLGLLLAGATAAPSPGRHAPRRTSSARIRCGCRAAPRRGRRAAGRASRNPAAICADCRATSRQLIRAAPQTSASPSGFLAAASATIAQMLLGRSQNAGTTRSPKRGSSRIAGMECCDQSIARPFSPCLHPVDMLRPGKARERTSVA